MKTMFRNINIVRLSLVVHLNAVNVTSGRDIKGSVGPEQTKTFTVFMTLSRDFHIRFYQPVKLFARG
jgi:hypothetical protein